MSPEDKNGVLSVTQATYNLINIIVGVGVLSVPYALKMSGYCALLLVVLVIYITATTGKWIGACVDMAAVSPEAEEVPPSGRDFGFLALVSLGWKFSIFINFVTVLEVWLALVCFVVMNGVNAGLVWPDVEPATSQRLLGLLATAFVFVPPRVFSYMSLLSTAAMAVAAIAMVASTAMLSHWARPYHHEGEAALINLENVPRSVGIIVFCFAGHPCFPGVRASMKAPSKWRKCIYVSFVVAFVYYCSFGYLGYVVFGAHTEQTMTDNLGKIEGSHFLRIMAAFCFLVKVQLTIPLLMNAIVVALWSPGSGEAQWPVGRVVLVVCVAALTTEVALKLANKVAVVASLAGSLLVMITSVLFPAVIHIIMSCKFRDRPRGFRTWMQYVFVIVFGVVMAVLGTKLAVQDLMA